MNTTAEKETIYRAIEGLFQDSAVRDRSFYPDFRRGWDGLLRRALESGECWLPKDGNAVYTLHHSYGGIDLCLDIDQLKIADWYAKEVRRGSRGVFSPERMRRSRSGELSFHESVCRYEPTASESALDEGIKNIIACALPGLPPELRIIYGNRWVDSRTGILMSRSFPFFLLQTDFVPAFLADPFQVCLYLFMMDVCIIKENYRKVQDSELRNVLHIFRPSPMLRIKGLI